MRRYARITGRGSYLPPRRLTNHDLAAELAQRGIETSDEWIVERTGIHARHFAAPDVASSDLALEASKKALEADRKSTRLNSSHQIISYAVFCLKKKKTPTKARSSRNAGRVY